MLVWFGCIIVALAVSHWLGDHQISTNGGINHTPAYGARIADDEAAQVR